MVSACQRTGWYSQVVAIVTQVMKVVNDLIKVPELNQTMQQMSKEMMKAGLIEEAMGEMMDDVFDTDDIEEDADAEVDKVGMQT
jgi:charged multivesicular body protein 3